jgi:TusA-related sulfurtransferase
MDKETGFTPDTLDLRQLPAPEPLMRALAAVESLAAGAVLRMLTPMRPLPLLEALKERRLGYSISDHEDGGCAVTVWIEDGPAGA